MKPFEHSRMTSSALALAIASVAILSPVAASAQSEAGSEAQADEPEGYGPVITVTARKREENLLETPIAISAFSTEEIEKRGISSVTDLVDNTPGINITGVNSGRNDRSFQQISLRGFTPSTTSSTLTASFIDGVPVASATALNAVVDPQRIEILKGPQNAYFGRNAFAGAINVVTREPGDFFSGSVSAEWTSRNGRDLSAALEGPIVDDLLSFRITGRSFATDGSYKNAYNPNETLGDQSTNTATLQLTFTPTPALKIKAFGMYSEDEDGPSPDGMVSAYEVRSVNGVVNIPYFSGNNNGTLVIPNQSNCMLNGFTAGISATETRVSRPFICGAVPDLVPGFSPAANTIEDPLLAASLANGDQRAVSASDGVKGYGLVREYVHLHLSMDYELGDTGLTLTSLTGYNDEFYSQVDDLDNYDSTAFRGSLAGIVPGARQVWNFPFMVERDNEDFSQELRLSYDNRGAVTGLLGVSYLESSFTRDLTNIFSEEQFLAPRSTGSLSAPGRSETWGIFGSASIDFTPDLNLSLEGRYQIDEIFAKAGGRGLNLADNNAYGLPGGFYAYGETITTETYENFLPRAIVSYDVNPDAMVYASYAKAVNVGIESFNTTFLSGSAAELAAAASIGIGVVTKPEKLDNFEAGFKGSFLNGRLTTTAAAFYAIWKDQYNNRSVTFLDNSVNPPVPQVVNGLANSGKTIIKGFELDVWSEPVDDLVFTFSGAINDSSIKSFSDPAISRKSGLIGDDFKGNQLALTSKYSFNTSLQYGGDITAWDDGRWFVRGDYNWKSKQYLDAANQTWVKGRGTMNARVGIARDGFTLEAFATNLFNNKDYVSLAQNSILEPSFALSGQGNGYVNVALPELRTFGIKAGYSF